MKTQREPASMNRNVADVTQLKTWKATLFGDVLEQALQRIGGQSRLGMDVSVGALGWPHNAAVDTSDPCQQSSLHFLWRIP